SLGALAEAAKGTGSLMPPILNAVKAYATLGEICTSLRGVFGDYQAATAV
ncbi:MAG: methylmalonyl-CoA mutase family protein, partial [Dehalococcoidia bacterium]